MGFNDSSYYVRSVPALPLISAYPDISQIRQFSESASFFDKIKEAFNQIMESQKWIKVRQTNISKMFGYENLETNPTLDTKEFVRLAVDKGKKQDANAGAKNAGPATTYADITLNENNLDSMTTNAQESLQAVNDALSYLINSESEVNKQWHYHNANIIHHVGIFANKDDFVANVNAFIANLSNAGDDGEKQGGIIKLRDDIIDKYNKLDKENRKNNLEMKEAVAISTIGTTNLSSSASHSRLKEEARQDKIYAQLKELGDKKAEMKARAERKRLDQQGMKAEKSQKAAASKSTAETQRNRRG